MLLYIHNYTFITVRLLTEVISKRSGMWFFKNSTPPCTWCKKGARMKKGHLRRQLKTSHRHAVSQWQCQFYVVVYLMHYWICYSIFHSVWFILSINFADNYSQTLIFSIKVKNWITRYLLLNKMQNLLCIILLCSIFFYLLVNHSNCIILLQYMTQITFSTD